MLKKVLMYVMAACYVVFGFLQVTRPGLFLSILPVDFPLKPYPVVVSGIAEIALGVMLLYVTTRDLAIRMIGYLLAVYFLAILIPLYVSLYHAQSPYFVMSLVAVPFQFLLFRWTRWYKTPTDHDHDDSLI